MGAESYRPFTGFGMSPFVTVPPDPGFHGCTEWDWRDWSFGLVLDTGPEVFGVRLWIGPAYIGGYYQRARASTGEGA